MDKSDPQGSFVCWQQIRIDQHTYAINLFLTFAVAALGFQVTLFLDGKYDSLLCLPLLSLAALLISVGIGIWVVINRLRDFRLTASIVRRREERQNEPGSSYNSAQDKELEHDRAKSRRMGDLTWCLFWWQIGTFATSMILVVAGIFVLKSSLSL